MPAFDSKARSRLGLLRIIAVYKIGKVLLLLATAYGVLRLRDASLMARIYSWAATLPSGLEQEVVVRGLAWFSGLSPGRVRALGFVTLAYAAIFAIEGVGLWMRKRWAEWLTTIITASLIPLEVWELGHRPGVGKAAVLVVNGAIVAYLVWQLRAERAGTLAGRATGKVE
jgi:uncharacterized membrane protein (DUF2068 family)